MSLLSSLDVTFRASLTLSPLLMGQWGEMHAGLETSLLASMQQALVGDLQMSLHCPGPQCRENKSAPRTQGHLGGNDLASTFPCNEWDAWYGQVKGQVKKWIALMVRLLQFIPKGHRIRTSGDTRMLAQPWKHSKGATQVEGNGFTRTLTWLLGPDVMASAVIYLGWSREDFFCRFWY